jgi:protein tyrosine/serine phosphatase
LVIAGFIACLVIAGPIAYKRWSDKQYRNFHVVEEGVLYRSGQLPLPRLQQLVAIHGIRTIVCLREGNAPPDQQEEAWVKAKALNFVRIPPKQWYPDETGKVPADSSVQTFREVMDDPANYPVLVHCFAGIHRTGTMCAIFRMDYQGWSNEEAMAEMRALGYTILDDHEDVHGYLMSYRAPAAAKAVPVLPVSRKTPRPLTPPLIPR